MPISIPRRLRSAPAGRFGPLGVDRHEVEAGGDPYTAFTLDLADWVAVAAITAGGQVLLVRQHRHGVDDVTLEVAGGIIDPGESPEQAALRELREETGYVADAVEPLGWVHPNPAIQGNRCWMFLARGARRAGEPDGDEHESVEPVLMDPEDAAAATRDGRVTHVLAVVALDRALQAVRFALDGVSRDVQGDEEADQGPEGRAGGEGGG